MSGLALVARALGPTVTGSDRAAGSPYGGAAARGGHRARDRARRGERARRAPSSSSPPRSRRRTRSAPSARERGQRELHRAAAAGRAHAPAPDRSRSPAPTARRRPRACSSTRCAAAGSTRATSSAARSARPGANAGWGAGEWLVVEADESDRSLLELEPEVAVLTNAELDHHTTYASARDVDDTFRPFLGLARRAAVVWDRPDAARARAGRPRRSSRSTRARARPPAARASRSTASRSSSSVPGAHNALNAAAALARRAARGRRPGGGRRRAARLPGRRPALRAARPDRRRAPRWSTTTRTTRRRSRATLEAARTLAPAPRRRRLPAAPVLAHRARTPREFGAALALADEVVVLDIYPARERAEDFPGVTGLLVARAAADAARREARRVAARRTRAAEALPAPRALRDGDLVLTLGAGDVDALGPRARAVSLTGVADGRGRRRRAANRWAWPVRRLPGACPRAWRSPLDRPAARLPLVPRLSFAAVEQVVVTGSGSSEGAQVRAALEAAGAGMSTLHVDEERAPRRRRAPSPRSPTCASRTDFPHTLRIEVVEHRAGRRSSRRTASRSPPRAAGCCSRASAPTTSRSSARPAAARGPRAGPARARGPAGRGRGAARAARARRAPVLRPGRDPARPARRARTSCSATRAPRAEKWRAAARVLADDSSAGATYLDLRVPGLVAAGGVGPLASRPRPRPSAPTAAVPSNPLPQAEKSPFSTSGRDFGGLQAILPRFAVFDIGKEIPVPCRNPRRKRALKNARL